MPTAIDLPSTPRLRYGVDVFSDLAVETARLTAAPGRVLLVADPGIPRLAAKAAGLLRAGGFEPLLFDQVRSDPLASQVDAAAARARASGVRCVIGLGGGSALDVAKLVAAVAPALRPAADYALGAVAFPEAGLPCLLIPTTAGTGAEATRTAIVTTDAGTKVWCWGEGLRAGGVLLDPRLSVGLPPALTLATGIDALVHAIEAATTRRRHPLSDAPALQAIRLVRRYLPQVLVDPGDLEARGGMLLAAWLAGQAIDSAGTGIAHALGHALGTLGHLHHGRAVGLCLRVALAVNAAAAPPAHARVAAAFGVDGRDEASLAQALPGAYDAFLRELGFDTVLDDPRLSVEALVRVTQSPANRPMLEANCHAYDETGLRRLAGALLAA